jgi:hypothetical protein
MSESASEDYVLVYDYQSDEDDEAQQQDESLDLNNDSLHADPSNLSKNNARRAPLQRHGVACKLCLEDIRGQRWMCVECGGEWSLCSLCFEGVSEDVHPAHTFVRVQSAADIYAPSTRKTTPMIHLDVLCSSCQCPILGVRYECIADECNRQVNLCQSCESLPLQAHSSHHPLVKYRVTRDRIARSSMLEYDDEHQQKQRRAFEMRNRPPSLSNKGLWELSKTHIFDEAALQARTQFSMEIDIDKETPWGSNLSPGSTFVKSWYITNKGTRAWPKGTSIIRVSPAVFSPAHFRKRIVSDDVVLVGSTVEVRFVGLQAPSAAATHVEVWALCDCDERLFGERLEIRITVGEKDKHASERHYGLEEALENVKEGKQDLAREKHEQGGGAEPCKMSIFNSDLMWEGNELSCHWSIQNTSKTRFPIGCQLRRINRSVGTALIIDDSEASISVPQGLRGGEIGYVSVAKLKVMPSAPPTTLKGQEQSTNSSAWITDTWIMVDSHGREFGQEFTFAQSFHFSELEVKAKAEGKEKRSESAQETRFKLTHKLVPDGEWRGKGVWMYRSCGDDGESVERV